MGNLLKNLLQFGLEFFSPLAANLQTRVSAQVVPDTSRTKTLKIQTLLLRYYYQILEMMIRFTIISAAMMMMAPRGVRGKDLLNRLLDPFWIDPETGQDLRSEMAGWGEQRNPPPLEPVKYPVWEHP